MSDSDIKNIYKKITSNNYLSNCYRQLTTSKIIHFIFILIEILLNLLHELDIFLRDFIYDNGELEINKLSLISYITIKINKLQEVYRLYIIFSFIIIFDSLFIFFKKKNFLIKHTYISIIINILELFYFRLIVLLFLNLLFSLSKFYFLISLLFCLPHIYLIISNFFYNHLYYFVPEYIDYPYDEFSSLFDIILLICKIILAASDTSSNVGLGKFCFIILFIMQIFFSFFFIEKLINHSYFFMKNSFLNETRLCLFLTKSIVIIFALLVGKNEIMNILFIIVSVGLLFIIMGYLYFLYNPYSYIKIKRETPTENIYFYLYIISNKTNLYFLFENKMNEHYENCGICTLCKKYINFYKKYESNKDKENEEKDMLLIPDKNNLSDDIDYQNNKNQLKDLFSIIYDGKNKYFQLIKKIVLNYKKKGKDSLINNAHYVNLSFLIYSDYDNNNITLSLNEKLILEILNQENRAILDNHQSQITQLLLCNKFIVLSNKVIEKIKDILNSEQDFNKAKKLIDLSFMLKKMRKKKYKINLFSHKLENISNSKNLISACSIIYEEIFNITLNNSQIPIRENIQPLEDAFKHNANKNEKIISLLVNLNNKNCKIIRAGKGLSSQLNNNLFDLFPLIFQQYQINLFLSKILTNFDKFLNKDKNDEINHSNIILNKKRKKKNNKANIKNVKSIRIISNNNKNKREFVDIKLIICENISSKVYYKLVTLKLTPLFNNDNNYFILFDGLFFIHKLTLISIIDYEKNNHSEEKIFAVSEPELEKNNETYSMTLKRYNVWQNNQGYNLSKVSSFNISFKLYSIYMLIPRDKEKKQKLERHLTIIKEGKLLDDEEEQEHNISQHKNTRIEKLNLMEDNASATSQQTSSSHEKGLSGLGLRNKKKENYYEYSVFNRLQKTIYLTIIIILIIITFEYIHLNSLEKQTKKNYNSFLEYREFYKLYFQLFSITLSGACILQNSSKCINLINFYTDKYFSLYPDDYFNYNSLLLMQSEIFAQKLMKSKVFMNNIHKHIGNNNYNLLLGKFINYSRVSQSFDKDQINFDIIQIETQFSEAILVMCNSFKVISEPNDTKSIIYFLNKTDEPFSYLNSLKTHVELINYQKEVYELILNYKLYSNELDSININLIKKIMNKKSKIIQVCVFVYINLDTLMIVFIASLICIYVNFFENIIVKILNYINMTMNVSNDNFQFDKMFTKKLDNLSIILQLYNEDPLKAVQNLNNIYNEYQQYLTTKNKNEAMELAKRGYRKYSEDERKKRQINIPKNQRIINKKEIKNLNIVNKYLIIFYILLIILVILYIFLTIFWLNYYSIKNNLYKLIIKNYNLETSVYRSIIIYNLMVFNNYTLSEVSKNIFPELYNESEPISIIKSFYENLKYAFNNKKEKDSINIQIYSDLEDFSNFTCEDLFELNNELLEEINNSTLVDKPTNIKERLIKICNNSKIAESIDSRAVFERHFQYIKNGLLSIDNFTYDGLMDHLKSGNLGEISFFFNIIIVFFIEILFSKPHQTSITNMLNLLSQYIVMTEITFIILDIIFIIVILFYFISKIKKYCNQISLLKNTFKIFEIQE